MPRTAQLSVNVMGLEAVKRLANALTDAVAILEMDRLKNCVRVEARPTDGTCWWDDFSQRLLAQLPPDACRYCRTRELLDRLAADGETAE